MSGASRRTPFSFEVYPPRSGRITDEYRQALSVLCDARPEFISVTYRVGGYGRKLSKAVLDFILQRGVAAMAHFTCVGNTYARAAELIGEFIDRGVSSFLALRGDLPAGVDPTSAFAGDLSSAAELVQLLRGVWQEKHPYRQVDLPGLRAQKVEEASKVRVAVAASPRGHPRSRNIDQDLDALLAKEAAGATLALTQIFFYADEYLGYVERARDRGVTIPIIPGIMPVTSPSRLRRVMELVGYDSSDYPAALGIGLEVEPDPWRRRQVGIEWATNLAYECIQGGAPGLHLYAFNQYQSVFSILVGLGLLSDDTISGD